MPDNKSAVLIYCMLLGKHNIWSACVQWVVWQENQETETLLLDQGSLKTIWATQAELNIKHVHLLDIDQISLHAWHLQNVCFWKNVYSACKQQQL